MKRSHHIALLTMGVSALFLTACDNTPKEISGNVFSSIEECQSSGTMDEAQCHAAFEQAVDQHETDAQQFASKGECEAEFGEGKCQRAPSDKGEARYRPSFSGFFIGTLVGQALARPVYPPAPGQQGFRTASGVPFAGTTGSVTLPTHSLARPAGGAPAIARGGFGSTSSALGSSSSAAKGASGG